MPDRILRAELLESEAWLSLKDNADRSAWLAVFLTADTFGNMPAGAHRLMRLWSPYGIDSTEKVARVLNDLGDVDLIRVYESDGKRYLHIPRFRQTRRYLGHLWPVPSWATTEEKQAFAKKSHVNPQSPHENLSEPRHGVGLGVGVKTKTKTPARKLAVSLPADFAISERVRAWAIDKGHTNLARHLESFVSYARRNGKKYVDWDEALMSAIREDWAKIGEQGGKTADGKLKVAL